METRQTDIQKTPVTECLLGQYAVWKFTLYGKVHGVTCQKTLRFIAWKCTVSYCHKGRPSVCLIQFHCKKVKLYNPTSELPYWMLLTPSGKVLHKEKFKFSKIFWQSKTDTSTACCQHHYVNNLICQNKCMRIGRNANYYIAKEII